MDDDLELPPPSPRTRHGRKHKKGRDGDDRPHDKPFKGDLEAEHRKFLLWMFGLGLVILVLMLLFNSHFDFAMDGGI